MITSIAKDAPASRGAAQPDLPRYVAGGLLVAMHGGPGGVAALRVAQALADRDRVPLAVVTVVDSRAPYPVDLIPNIGAFDAVRMEDARIRVGAMVTGATPAGRQTPPVTVLLGRPADVIAKLARDRAVGLVLLGLGHRHVLDRVLGNETAIHVLRQALVPLLATAPDAPSVPRVVVAATDFSPSAMAAARMACRLAAPDGRIYLVHVQPELGAARSRHPADETWVRIVQRGTAAMFERMHHELRGACGASEDVTLRETVPGCVRALRDFAARVHADLIAIGTHGSSKGQRAMLGSVAEGVLRTAACSVLAVPEIAESGW